MQVYEEANKREHANMSLGAHVYERVSVSLRNERVSVAGLRGQNLLGLERWKGREDSPN